MSFVVCRDYGVGLSKHALCALYSFLSDDADSVGALRWKRPMENDIMFISTSEFLKRASQMGFGQNR